MTSKESSGYKLPLLLKWLLLLGAEPFILTSHVKQAEPTLSGWFKNTKPFLWCVCYWTASWGWLREGINNSVTQIPFSPSPPSFPALAHFNHKDFRNLTRPAMLSSQGWQGAKQAACYKAENEALSLLLLSYVYRISASSTLENPSASHRDYTLRLHLPESDPASLGSWWQFWKHWGAEFGLTYYKVVEMAL